jgi:hypothetical protein
MKRIVWIALIVVLAGAGNRCRTTSIASAEDETKPSCDSPRLAALAKQLTGDEAGNRATIGKFLDDLSGKAPLVEPVEGDPHSRWITFLWRGGSDTHRVGVLGGPPSAEFGEQLQRLKNSNLWYRTDKVPSDSRFVYHFLINMPDKIPDDGPAAASFWKENPMRQDPLNRLASPSNHGSIAELPDAPLQPWLERVPTYKEALENVKDKDLHTYGFLGYPTLQTADIVIYSEDGVPLVVPVGEDQVSHVELSREIVRRFNFYYGFKIDKELDLEENLLHKRLVRTKLEEVVVRMANGPDRFVAL